MTANAIASRFAGIMLSSYHHTQCHAPRKRGIQCNRNFSRLDRPPSRAMTPCVGSVVVQDFGDLHAATLARRENAGADHRKRGGGIVATHLGLGIAANCRSELLEFLD